MHLFIEVFTLACFLLAAAHAWASRGGAGAWFFASLLALGLVRENFVILVRYLYEFAPLSLMLGKAPLIASIIWGFSIYVAVVWAEGLTGEDALQGGRPSAKLLGLVAVFMIALACFYEPFLGLIGMARWEVGTRAIRGIPWITWIGYPTLAVGALLAWSWAWKVSRGGSAAARLAGALLLTLVPLALAHAAGLQALKDFLAW